MDQLDLLLRYILFVSRYLTVMKLYAVVLFSEVVVVDLLKFICIGERACILCSSAPDYLKKHLAAIKHVERIW